MKYAEMLYSSKRDKLDDLITARKYFMLAAILHEKKAHPSVRALFGVIKATKAIAKVSVRNKDERGPEMIRAAQEQIREVYQAKGGAKMLAALEKMPVMQPIPESQ